MTSGCATTVRCRSEEYGSMDESSTHPSKRHMDRTHPHEADGNMVGAAEKDAGRGRRVGTSGRSDGGSHSDSKRNPSEVNPPINNMADVDISCSAVPETEGVDSTGTRRPTLDVPSTASAAASATRGNSASLSSNSSALTSASSGRTTQMKVIYYQNRFIAIPIPSATTHNQRQPSDDTDNNKNDDDDDVTSGSVNPLADGNADVIIGAQFPSAQTYHPHHHHHHHNHPTSDRTGASSAAQEASFQMDRKSYLVLRFIELLHDKDQQQPKRTKASHRSRATLALVKCLNLFFLAMGILLFVGVLIAIAFSSVMQWLNVST